jgi:hypothetical protein
MRSKLLLSVAAIALASTNLFAGKLYGVNDVNVSKEWVLKNKLTKTDANITFATESIIYVPTDIPAGSLDNPTLNINFIDVKKVEVPTDIQSKLGICEVGNDSNVSVLKFDHVDTANKKIVFRSIDAANTMGNSKKYYICDIETNQTSSALKITYTLDPDKTPGLEFVLYSGDSQEPRDRAVPSSILNKVEQLCAKVVTTADAKIDPATGFVAFGQNIANNGCSSATSNETADNIEIAFYDMKKNIGNANYEVGKYAILANITASKELPLNTKETTYTVSNGTKEKLVISDNKIFKMAAKGIDYTATPLTNDTTTMSLTITVDGETPLQETTFTADLGFNLLNETDAFTHGLVTTTDAGKWSFKGTLVAMPYVVKNDDTTTAIRLTNGQNVNADVYWTCTDDNGVVVPNIKVPSVTSKTTSIPANGAAAWLARDILKVAQDANPDFAPNGKMKCKALVTATDGVCAVEIMQINGGRDRVIPTSVMNNQ